MVKLLPPGMLPLLAALARTAEARLPEAWGRAKPNERVFLHEGAENDSFWSTVFTGSESLAGRAYEVLRPMLAGGALPAFVRGRSGAPVAVDPAAWEATSTDRLRDVGTELTLVSGDVASGEILIRSADLEAALRGESVSLDFSKPVKSKTPRPAQTRRRGRPENPDNDRFWIEVCRRIYEGVPFEPQKDFVAGMLEWAEVNMKLSHNEDTVRRKVSGLVAALNRPD